MLARLIAEAPGRNANAPSRCESVHMQATADEIKPQRPIRRRTLPHFLGTGRGVEEKSGSNDPISRRLSTDIMPPEPITDLSEGFPGESPRSFPRCEAR